MAWEIWLQALILIAIWVPSGGQCSTKNASIVDIFWGQAFCLRLVVRLAV